MNDSSTTRLAELVAQRLKCLEQLLALCQRQMDVIAAGDANDLLRLLAGKQQLLAALQLIDAKLEPFRQQDPDSRQWAAPADRARCAADADRCRELLAEVMQLEQRGQEQASQQQSAVSRQLKSCAAAPRIRDAYLANNVATRTDRGAGAARAPGAPHDLATGIAPGSKLHDSL